MIAKILWILYGVVCLCSAPAGFSSATRNGAGDGTPFLPESILLYFGAIGTITIVLAARLSPGRDTRTALTLLGALGICGLCGIVFSMPAIILQWRRPSDYWLKAQAHSVTAWGANSGPSHAVQSPDTGISSATGFSTGSAAELLEVLKKKMLPLLTEVDPRWLEKEHPPSRAGQVLYSGPAPQILDLLRSNLENDAALPRHEDFFVGRDTAPPPATGILVYAIRASGSTADSLGRAYHIWRVPKGLSLLGHR